MNGYVIFPFDPSNAVMRSVFPEKVKKAELSATELETIETLLKKCVDNYNVSQELHVTRLLEGDSSASINEFAINVNTYQKQYVPVINEAGQKIVWVNAFCYLNDDRWKKDLIKVDDGGKCFFNLKVNLTTGAFYNMVWNGEE